MVAKAKPRVPHLGNTRSLIANYVASFNVKHKTRAQAIDTNRSGNLVKDLTKHLGNNSKATAES